MIMNVLMIHLIDDTQVGFTALHIAVSNGHYDCAQLLIHVGCDVNSQDNVSTPYVHTVHHYDHTLKIYPIDCTQGGFTALFRAVMNGYYDCAQLLIVSAAETTIRNNV